MQTQSLSLRHFTHHIQTTHSEHKFTEVKRAHPTKSKIEYISNDEDALAAMPSMTEQFTSMSKDPIMGKRAMLTADDMDNNNMQAVSTAAGTKCTQQMTVSDGAPEPGIYLHDHLVSPPQTHPSVRGQAHLSHQSGCSSVLHCLCNFRDRMCQSQLCFVSSQSYLLSNLLCSPMSKSIKKPFNAISL
jgi:hypothetical protein